MATTIILMIIILGIVIVLGNCTSSAAQSASVETTESSVVVPSTSIEVATPSPKKIFTGEYPPMDTMEEIALARLVNNAVLKVLERFGDTESQAYYNAQYLDAYIDTVIEYRFSDEDWEEEDEDYNPHPSLTSMKAIMEAPALEKEFKSQWQVVVDLIESLVHTREPEEYNLICSAEREPMRRKTRYTYVKENVDLPEDCDDPAHAYYYKFDKYKLIPYKERKKPRSWKNYRKHQWR